MVGVADNNWLDYLDTGSEFLNEEEVPDVLFRGEVWDSSLVSITPLSSPIEFRKQKELEKQLEKEETEDNSLWSPKKGSNLDFHGAMGGEKAKELYQMFVEKFKQG
ncbi:hypothetical protein BJ875DRAFT_436367 [Amylocarpus encephaloides]|uniref:Uncharacterized protein n=1 Tax=Amylocarpus encephaloides TaxID=45428 RepID=A0A9P7YV24_9HELO|nr:hypothetical protein BJ875DRAFT_436367 [Amylocarpus encephaloides]